MTLFTSLPSHAPPKGDGIQRSAVFHRNGVRLVLSRVWGAPKMRRLLVVGHNPSTAGAEVDDPTSRRITYFARQWGWPGYDLVNPYPWQTPDPEACRRIARYESGTPLHILKADQLANMRAIQRLAADATMVLVAWGDLCRDEKWRDHVLRIIADAMPGAKEFHCLGVTASGNPKHPMARGRSRVPDDQQPVVWRTV